MLEGRQEPSFEKKRPGHKSKYLRRIAAALCLIAAIVAAIFLRIQLAPGSVDTKLLARIGHPLPALIVEGSEGVADLGKLAPGTRSIIVFYSPSCKTCERVLPALQPFPSLLRLILVNESPDEGSEAWSGFPDAVHFYDRQKILSRLFAAPALPTILFVDESGILRDGIVGFYQRAYVQRKLQDFAIHSYGHIQKGQ
jgi:hypothetical protein